MTSASSLRSVLLLIACAALAAGATRAREQQPAPAASLPGQPRDAPPGPRARIGTAVIRGVVTSSGQPLQDARVMVSSMELPGGRNVLTDERGRFSAGSLPGGRYSVTVMKAGYLTASWGQRVPRGPGRFIHLADAETREISLEVPRAGVITGMVVNDRGEPVIGTGVQAAQIVTMNGQRTFRPVGGTSSDDRGVYRLHSLQPGEYLVCAAPHNHESMSDAQAIRRNLESLRRARIGPTANPEAARKQLEARIAELEAQLTTISPEPVRGYAPACVPGHLPGLHSTLTIGPAEERIAVDLQLERTRLASIEGTLILPPGVTAEHVNISIVNTNPALLFAFSGGMLLEQNGRFVRENLVPGEYRLEARTRTTGHSVGRVMFGPGVMAPVPLHAEGSSATAVPKFWARADLVVDGSDISGLTLELLPALSISGEVVFEGTARRPADLSRLQIVANPVLQPYPGFSPAESAHAGADHAGRFTIAGVFPGTYRLGTGTDGWSLKSVMAVDRDVLDFPLEITRTDVTGILITLTDRVAEITGTVVDSRGDPASDYSVVLFAADHRYWTPGSRRMRLTRVDAGGRFTFRGMPAGEYRLAPLLDYDTGDWSAPAVLQGLESVSTPLWLGEGEKRTVSLRVRGE